MSLANSAPSVCRVSISLCSLKRANVSSKLLLPELSLSFTFPTADCVQVVSTWDGEGEDSDGGVWNSDELLSSLVNSSGFGLVSLGLDSLDVASKPSLGLDSLSLAPMLSLRLDSLSLAPIPWGNLAGVGERLLALAWLADVCCIWRM